MIAGVLVKLAGNLILVPIPRYNISGAAISTVLSYGVILFSGVIALKKVTGIKINIAKVFIAPMYAGLLCSATAVLVYSFLHFLPLTLSLPLSIASGGVVYLFSCFLLSLPKFKFTDKSVNLNNS
jgi:O-antigen/teichoic acid export membrane protein